MRKGLVVVAVVSLVLLAGGCAELPLGLGDMFRGEEAASGQGQQQATPTTVFTSVLLTTTPVAPAATATPVPLTAATSVPTATVAPATPVPTQTAAPTLTPTATPTGARTATPTTAAATAAAVQQAVVTATVVTSCPAAAQLGPWAPGSGGKGETFEVTAARGPVHLSLWWPHGNTPWGQKEVSVLLPPGTSITVLAGAGTGWDYATACPTDEVTRQVEAYRTLRPTHTNFEGAVELQRLLDLGLLVRRR